MIIAVDFDGTISRGRFPAIDGEQPYAGESLRKLHDEGHKIINWLLERKIPFDRVNDHDPENVAKYGEGGKKIYAHCYIDDKNIGGFPGWLACVEEIERMEEAYKTILKEDKTKV